MTRAHPMARSVFVILAAAAAVWIAPRDAIA